jgi:hypothetical protein
MAWRNKVAEAQETTSILTTIAIIEKTPTRNDFQSDTQSLGICQNPGL